MTGADVVRSADLAWSNGQAVYDSMAPAFRDNLGEPAAVRDLLSRYWLKPLFVETVTTQRVDHIRTDPGYRDLSNAYHDSVEECLVLSGEVQLSAEGRLQAGDYFWRPPGWVHMAESAKGFEAFLMMEGESAGEGSCAVTRIPRPDSEAGHNHLHPHESPVAIGPRGYCRRVESRFMPWWPLDDRRLRIADGSEAVVGLSQKVLSANAETGAASMLVATEPGWVSRTQPIPYERILVVADGSLDADGRRLDVGSLVRIEPGAPTPELRSPAGCVLFVKTAG